MFERTFLAAGVLVAALASVHATQAEAGSRLHYGGGVPGGHNAYYEPSSPGYFDQGGYYEHVPVFSPRRSSCHRARARVRDYGYHQIRTVECRGPTYTFQALRDGRWWKVKVRARNGRIRRVYPL